MASELRDGMVRVLEFPAEVGAEIRVGDEGGVSSESFEKIRRRALISSSLTGVSGVSASEWLSSFLGGP